MGGPTVPSARGPPGTPRMAGVRVVAAPDKFRGTASARAVAAAIGDAAGELGWDCDEVPMADGGEGTLDVLGGPNRTTMVTGPLGDPVEAAWRLDGRTAVIEMARRPGSRWSAGPRATTRWRRRPTAPGS